MNRSRLALCVLAAVALAGCSGSTTGSGFQSSGSSGGSSGSSGSGSGSSGSGSGSGSSSGGFSSGGSGGSSGSSSGGTTTTTTTIYAHTDTELYSLDPQTNALTDIGAFSGLSGSSSDDSITDLAVDAAGDVWVNSETVIYKATLPAGGKGSVTITKVSTISGSSQKFYALGFTTKDALGTGTGEVLIGGDGNGELWSIDTSSGATKDLGGFGTDPNDSSSVLALSGDVVFYVDSTNTPRGLATIRSCTQSKSGSTTCDGSTDYLAGIDMTALASAYSGSTASSLNAGIYGSTSASPDGPGIGFKDVFGLGAWDGNVYGFTRATGGVSATLVSIATSGSSAGVGAPTTSQANVTSGWSGAGVTTTVTVTVPNPPPPPK